MRNNLTTGLKLSIAVLFMVSALGKALDVPGSAQSLSQLFFIDKEIAALATYLLVVMEVVLSIIIIWGRTSIYFIMIPIGFSAILGYAYIQGQDCGCFGNLPFLSDFSIGGHFLLNAGLIAGFYYLGTSDAQRDDIKPQDLRIGIFGLAFIVLSFVSIPFTGTPQSSAVNDQDKLVSLDELRTIIKTKSAVIIDARSPMQYDFGHIPGAINIPLGSDELAALIEQHDLREKPLITYCSSEHCPMAEELMGDLIAQGCKNVRLYAGGWQEWEIENF